MSACSFKLTFKHLCAIKDIALNISEAQRLEDLRLGICKAKGSPMQKLSGSSKF